MEWQNFPKGGTYYGQLINCSALAGRRLGGHGLVHQLLGEGGPELLDRSGGLNNLLAALRVGTTPFNIFLLLRSISKSQKFAYLKKISDLVEIFRFAKVGQLAGPGRQ